MEQTDGRTDGRMAASLIASIYTFGGVEGLKEKNVLMQLILQLYIQHAALESTPN